MILLLLLLLLVGVLHLGMPFVVFVSLVRTPAATLATPVFLNAIVACASMQLALFGSQIVDLTAGLIMSGTFLFWIGFTITLAFAIFAIVVAILSVRLVLVVIGVGFGVGISHNEGKFALLCWHPTIGKQQFFVFLLEMVEDDFHAFFILENNILRLLNVVTENTNSRAAKDVVEGDP